MEIEKQTGRIFEGTGVRYVKRTRKKLEESVKKLGKKHGGNCEEV